MKREARPEYEKWVYLLFPLKWRRCYKCGKEVRLETMYYDSLRDRWGCRDCFTDKYSFYSLNMYNRPRDLEEPKEEKEDM